MLRRLLFILMVLTSAMIGAETLDKLIPSHSSVLSGYADVDSVRRSIDERGASDIEGIWEIAGSQNMIVIEPCTDQKITHTGIKCLQIVLLSSPRRSIRPGTVLGYIIPSARAGYYDARLYTENIRSVLQRYRRFTMRLTDDGHMSMSAVKPAWRLTLRHTFNFLVRAGISQQQVQDHLMEGFIKLYPTAGIKPLKPVYL